MLRRIQVPPGGSVRRLVPVTVTGASSVTVLRDVTRQVESRVTPVWGPASRRTDSVAAAAGGAASVPASAVARRARRRTRSARAALVPVMAEAPGKFEFRRGQPVPPWCLWYEDPVTIR